MKTILHADNDPDFLRTRSEFLEQEGYRVVPASSPTEARRAFEQGGIDLAILDIRMVEDDDDKDVSGLTLAKDPAYRSIPKIILTGFPTVQAVREMLGPALDGLPPAVDFVAKEDGPEAMLGAVRKALDIGVPEKAEAIVSGVALKRARVRLAGGIAAIITLLLSMGAGIVAIVVGDPRWLLATVFFAILMVVGTGLAIFLPN
jgi:CheY-like chemotaxis protein